MTRYCPDCGTGHECEAQTADRAARAEVEIEKLRTNRDIEVARITAAAAVDTAETGAAEEAARAAGVVEGAEAVLEAAAGEAAEPGEAAEVIPDGPPVVIEAEPGAEIDALPPPETAETPTVAEPGGGGWWGSYH